jgi:hypothetical protein
MPRFVKALFPVVLLMLVAAAMLTPPSPATPSSTGARPPASNR